MPARDLPDDQRQAGRHRGQLLYRDLDLATLTVMRDDVDALIRAGGKAVAGWTFIAVALDQAWAYAQSAKDRAEGAPPLPENGPPPPCPRPALHHITGYTPAGGNPYGSLDSAIHACGAHALEYRARLTAELGTAYDNGPLLHIHERPCGSRFDFRRNPPARDEKAAR